MGSLSRLEKHVEHERNWLDSRVPGGKSQMSRIRCGSRLARWREEFGGRFEPPKVLIDYVFYGKIFGALECKIFGK